jgi:hypothetical protein
MSNNVCGGRVGSTGKKICISSSCRIMAHRGAPAPEFLSAWNSTKGQLFISVPNAGDSQKEEVYATPVMSASGLGVQLQSMITDKASVATWEGVFKAASVEVMTDAAEVTDRLRRGAEDLHMGLTAKKKPRFSPSGEGILESELVRLPTSLVGPPEDAMIRLQGCWDDLVGNQSAAVNLSVAADNVAERLRRTIEIELDQVDIKFAQLKRGIGERPSSLSTTTLYDAVSALNAETKELKQGVES